MKISVIGTGYVGLVSGLGLARIGHTVTCFDVNSDIIDRLRRSEPTIHEDGLEAELKDLSAKGAISFDLVSPEALSKSDVILIAVGTPSHEGDIDLRFIRSAAKMAGEAILQSNHSISVIVKSTVIPGTTSGVVRDEIESVIAESNHTYGLGMNPEFLREGSAIADFQNPDRIVLGHEDAIALSHLREMYAPFDCPKVEVNTKTAELIKYANNFLLAMQISAANELANLAMELGDVDPYAVMQAVIQDRRWSGNWETGAKPPAITTYLIPGPGFGGSCFPKDVEALISLGSRTGSPQTLAAATLAVNQSQPAHTVDQLVRSDLTGKRVLVLGLAFKPDTDDVRETPSFGVIQALQARGAKVLAHDPMAVSNFNKSYGSSLGEIEYVESWVDVAPSTDIVFVVTPWQEYKDQLPNCEAEILQVVDPRHAFFGRSFPKGWTYTSLGVSK